MSSTVLVVEYHTLLPRVANDSKIAIQSKSPPKIRIPEIKKFVSAKNNQKAP